MIHRMLVTASLIALGGSVVACSDGPRLRFDADPHTRIGSAVSDLAPDQPYSFGAIMMCVTSPSTATITGVSIHDATGDIRVEAFGVRPNPMPARFGLGGERSTLAAYGSGFVLDAPQDVTGVCPKDVGAASDEEAARLFELGVQVRLGSGEIGGGDDLDVTYRIDGRDRVLTIPWGLWLCARTCPPGTGTFTSPPG